MSRGLGDVYKRQIPSSVTKIEKGEFRYSKDTVTLYVKKGSYAEKYAKKNKLRYKYSK